MIKFIQNSFFWGDGGEYLKIPQRFITILTSTTCFSIALYSAGRKVRISSSQDKCSQHKFGENLEKSIPKIETKIFLKEMPATTFHRYTKKKVPYHYLHCYCAFIPVYDSMVEYLHSLHLWFCPFTCILLNHELVLNNTKILLDNSILF